MFKRSYFKHIIPDIIFAVGVVILLLGLFYVIQPDSITKNEKVVTALENQGDLQLDKEIQLSMTDKSTSTSADPRPDNTIEDQVSKLPSDKIDEEKPNNFSLVIPEKRKLNIFPLEIKLENKVEDLMALTEYKNEKKDINGTLDSYFKEKNNFFAGISKTDLIENKEKVTIVIPEGSSGQEVAHIFEESNLMTYEEFIQLLLLFNIETRLKAGKYSFDSDSSVSDILSKILIK